MRSLGLAHSPPFETAPTRKSFFPVASSIFVLRILRRVLRLSRSTLGATMYGSRDCRDPSMSGIYRKKTKYSGRQRC